MSIAVVEIKAQLSRANAEGGFALAVLALLLSWDYPRHCNAPLPTFRTLVSYLEF